MKGWGRMLCAKDLILVEPLSTDEFTGIKRFGVREAGL